jgi:dephospho-CoA kinase
MSACVPNQARFYSRFDHIVLLSASPELTIQRLMARTNNPYGRSAREVAEILGNKATIEPLLRRSATDEIDTATPLHDVVARVLEIATS